MTKTSKEEFNSKTHNEAQTVAERQGTSQPDFPIDVDYFQQFLDDPNASEEEKRLLIETVWSIVCSAIDLGFNVHPLQQAKAELETSCQTQDNLTSALQQIALGDQ